MLLPKCRALSNLLLNLLRRVRLSYCQLSNRHRCITEFRLIFSADYRASELKRKPHPKGCGSVRSWCAEDYRIRLICPFLIRAGYRGKVISPSASMVSPNNWLSRTRSRIISASQKFPRPAPPCRASPSKPNGSLRGYVRPFSSCIPHKIKNHPGGGF